MTCVVIVRSERSVTVGTFLTACANSLQILERVASMAIEVAENHRGGKVQPQKGDGGSRSE